MTTKKYEDKIVVIDVGAGKRIVNVPTLEECHAASVAAWATVPEADRKRCVEHLRTSLTMMGHAEFIDRWATQLAAGSHIGSDMPGAFHFGPGMGIRNILRQVMTDDELPALPQPCGNVASNWDDYYYGALVELATRQP